jgi:hypothetical protein
LGPPKNRSAFAACAGATAKFSENAKLRIAISETLPRVFSIGPVMGFLLVAIHALKKSTKC